MTVTVPYNLTVVLLYGMFTENVRYVITVPYRLVSFPQPITAKSYALASLLGLPER